MICDDVRRVVYFFLDGQLGDKKQQDITTHLNLCPDCEQRTAISRRMRSFVQRRLNNLQTPVHLKQRLERSIRAFRTEWSSTQ
jgi:mycothiol system anti-sigma-R factor